jgi:hypothetical protein
VAILQMVHRIRAELVESGMAPKDLIDIHDFIWTTLRPAARKQLEEKRNSAAAS